MRTASLPREAHLLYRPALLGRTSAHYARATYDLDTTTSLRWIRPLTEKATPSDPWEHAEPAEGAPPGDRGRARSGRTVRRLPAEAFPARSYAAWQKALVNHIYREMPLVLWRSKPHKLVSAVGETEGDFRQRLVQLEREKRDRDVERLRARHAKAAEALQERVRKAEQRVEVEREQYKSAKTGALISLGQTVLGALFGRRKLSRTNVGKAGTTMRGAGRAYDQRKDIERAEENVHALREDLEALDAKLTDEVAALEVRIDPASFELDEVSVRAKKSSIAVEKLTLAWMPWALLDDGTVTPLSE